MPLVFAWFKFLILLELPVDQQLMHRNDSTITDRNAGYVGVIQLARECDLGVTFQIFEAIFSSINEVALQRYPPAFRMNAFSSAFST